MPLLASPATPYLAASLACALLAAIGLVFASRGRPAPIGPGLAALPPLVIGQIAGIGLAGMLLLAVVVGGPQGMPRLLLLAGALAAYLGLGVALPRRPQVQRQREAARLRRLTPGLIAFVRVALGSFESPIAVLRRYTARPAPQLAPMQLLVAEALQRSQDQRLRPFGALAAVARERTCRELIDLADALAQAEAEGSPVETVLAAQQETLELILQSEFKRMLRRRTMYLLLMVAISLVVGILLNLLFVMTGGGSVFSAL